MTEQQPIPIPWSQRWRRFRHRGFPPLCFLASVVFCTWMWQEQGTLPNAVGEVEAIRVQVNTLGEGQLIPLANRPGGQWQLFDHVDKGQLIATLDSRTVTTSLDAFAQRTSRLSDQLQTAADQMLATDMPPEDRTTLGHALQIEQLQLAGLQYEAQLARDRIQLSRLRLPDLLTDASSEENRETNQPIESEDARRQQLENLITQHQRAVEGTKAEQSQLASRFGNTPRFMELQSQLLAPFQAAISDALVSAEKFRKRARGLEIRSPMDGTIMKIHCWPGENVAVGEPVVTLAAERSGYVVSYILENRGIVPQKGTRVKLRPRTPSGIGVVSVVEVVGPQVERVPSHIASDSERPEWGTPVRIKLPVDLITRPGALLDITFQPGSTSGL